MRIVAFCSSALMHRITRIVPAAAVHSTWTAFFAQLAQADCIIIAAEALAEYEWELEHLREQLPNEWSAALLIVSEPTPANIQVLRHLTYEPFVTSDTAEQTLLPALREIDSALPRTVAARALLSQPSLSALSGQVVREVLRADVAVRDQFELATRLGVSINQIRRAWKSDIRPNASVGLKDLIKWSRRFREAELIARGHSVLAVAVALDVDTSTVYRDLGGKTHSSAAATPRDVLFEFLAAFRLIGGPVMWMAHSDSTKQPRLWATILTRLQRKFIFAKGSPRIAKVPVVYCHNDGRSRGASPTSSKVSMNASVRPGHSSASRWGLLAAALLFIADPDSLSSLHAQSAPREIAGGQTCVQCRIERGLAATITDTSYAGGAIGIGAYVHRNQNGTFLIITGPGMWDEVYLVSDAGAIRHRVGRTGDGPGEFRLPMYVMETRSSYLIADLRLGRMSYVSKADLRVTRTATIPGRIVSVTPVAFGDGGYVFWGEVATRDNAGHGLHVVSPEGIAVRSFGPPPRGGTPPVLAASGDTAFWVAYDSYRLELWSREGRLLSAHQRTADWIKPDAERKPGSRFSALMGVREDPNGMLWTNTVIRTRDASGLRTVPDREANETVIEVLDPRSGKVVAQQRYGALRAPMIEGAGLFLVETRSASEGHTMIDVWALRLIR